MVDSKKLVIITGASSGIGLAAARIFCEAGHPLLLIARQMEAVTEFREAPAILANLDVGDFVAFEKTVQSATERFGPAHCLINSAGMADARSFEQVSPADYEHEIRTNLFGTLNGIKTVFTGMVERKEGTIINISSLSDRKTCSVSVGYTASKYAVRAVSESLREAAAQAGVRVINIAPGYIRTNIHSGMHISFDEYKNLLGNPDFMTAEELAEIIYYCYRLPPHICVRDLVVTPTRTTF